MPLPCRAQMTADHCMHIRYCVRLFDKFGQARAPVLVVGKIVGIVSYADRAMKWLGERAADCRWALVSA